MEITYIIFTVTQLRTAITWDKNIRFKADETRANTKIFLT